MHSVLLYTVNLPMLGGAYNEGRDSPVPCSRGLVLTISVSESVVERDVECLSHACWLLH